MFFNVNFIWKARVKLYIEVNLSCISRIFQEVFVFSVFHFWNAEAFVAPAFSCHIFSYLSRVQIFWIWPNVNVTKSTCHLSYTKIHYRISWDQSWRCQYDQHWGNYDLEDVYSTRSRTFRTDEQKILTKWHWKLDAETFLKHFWRRINGQDWHMRTEKNQN